MVPPRQPRPFAPVIMVVAVLPSIFPKASVDVQTTFRAIRPNARARNALSEGSAGLGRAYRFSADSGQQLAADGVRLSAAIRRSRFRPRLAVNPRHGYAVGGGGRSPRSGPGGGTRRKQLSADRSAD